MKFQLKFNYNSVNKGIHSPAVSIYEKLMQLENIKYFPFYNRLIKNIIAKADIFHDENITQKRCFCKGI